MGRLSGDYDLVMLGQGGTQAIMDKLPGKSDGECASPAGLACCSDVSAVRTGDRQGKA